MALQEEPTSAREAPPPPACLGASQCHTPRPRLPQPAEGRGYFYPTAVVTGTVAPGTGQGPAPFREASRLDRNTRLRTPAGKVGLASCPICATGPSRQPVWPLSERTEELRARRAGMCTRHTANVGDKPHLGSPEHAASHTQGSPAFSPCPRGPGSSETAVPGWEAHRMDAHSRRQGWTSQEARGTGDESHQS